MFYFQAVLLYLAIHGTVVFRKDIYNWWLQANSFSAEPSCFKPEVARTSNFSFMNTPPQIPQRDNSIPDLIQIARHERAVLSNVSQAKEKAAALIAAARVHVDQMEAESTAALEEELTCICEEAEQRRHDLHAAILAIAENRARHEVDRARSHLPEVVEALMRMVLPGGEPDND